VLMLGILAFVVLHVFQTVAGGLKRFGGMAGTVLPAFLIALIALLLFSRSQISGTDRVPAFLDWARDNESDDAK